MGIGAILSVSKEVEQMYDYTIACEIASVAKRLGLTRAQLARFSGFGLRKTARLWAGYDQHSIAAHHMLCILYAEIIHRSLAERQRSR